jgi:hypothetical protein
MARTLDFLINKNVDYAIDILSSTLEIDRSQLVEKFLNYDFSGTDYFDKVFREISGVTIWDINEIDWYRLCDAYDLCGENYPSAS